MLLIREALLLTSYRLKRLEFMIFFMDNAIVMRFRNCRKQFISYNITDFVLEVHKLTLFYAYISPKMQTILGLNVTGYILSSGKPV